MAPGRAPNGSVDGAGARVPSCPGVSDQTPRSGPKRFGAPPVRVVSRPALALGTYDRASGLMRSDLGEEATCPQPSARTAIRSPRAAAVAGIVFSLLLAFALALGAERDSPRSATAGDWLADSSRRHAVVVALNLLPFAAIAFLWFIGVVRDRIGEGEDRFFATVFLGAGWCSSP